MFWSQLSSVLQVLEPELQVSAEQVFEMLQVSFTEQWSEVLHVLVLQILVFEQSSRVMH
jgi:hypothetical protein